MTRQRPHRTLIGDLLRYGAEDVRAMAAAGEDAPSGEYANGMDDAADIIDRILAPLAGGTDTAQRAATWREVASWVRHQCAHQFGVPVCAECLALTARIDAFADQITKGAPDAPPAEPL